MTGREKQFSVICAAALVLFAVGASVAIMIGNFFAGSGDGCWIYVLPFLVCNSVSQYYKKKL